MVTRERMRRKLDPARGSQQERTQAPCQYGQVPTFGPLILFWIP
jgi:hypothetical protein